MRSISLLVAALGLSLGGSPALAESATQFDLACIGTRQMELDGPAAPLTYRLRIDLDAGRWCWNECERTFPIAEVAPDRLTLQAENVETARRRSWTENAVSRTTGEHRALWIESRPIPTYMETKGSCTPETFSGFPSARF